MGTYNRDNYRDFIAMIEHAYKELCKYQREPDAVAFFSREAYRIAIHVRNVSGVDMCSLSFPYEEPPLAPSHPLVRALSPLEHTLEQAANRVDAGGFKNDTDFIIEFYLLVSIKLILFPLSLPLKNFYYLLLIHITSLVKTKR